MARTNHTFRSSASAGQGARCSNSGRHSVRRLVIAAAIVYDAKAKLKGSKRLTFKKASQKSTLSLATKKWKTGRYTFVLQFTDANGTPGPVVVTQLRIT
jgi:hypothetical protein